MESEEAELIEMELRRVVVRAGEQGQGEMSVREYKLAFVR